MSSNTNKKGQPSIDPYDALGIAFGASVGEITKAYRKLALKLHPDKQRQGLNGKEQEEIAKKFHAIKEARAFLLDAEHAEDRRQYDARRESERVRRETEAERERHMSDRRKRMRDQLREKEARAKAEQQQDEKSRSARQQEKSERDLVDRLRKEGQQRREEQAQRNAEKEVERQLRQEQQERKNVLEERQVRLKWDRKKLKISPSEDSIAVLLSRFGTVEGVEFLGKKGNQALVTFRDASSCRPCVDAYLTSKEMRAKFVGQRKDQDQDDDNEDDNDGQGNDPSSPPPSKSRDGETLEERRIRQAVERESLLRQMQQSEHAAVDENIPTNDHNVPMKSKESRQRHGSGIQVPFPLPFPHGDKLHEVSPFEKLESLEEDILARILTSDELRSIKRKMS